MIMGDATPEGKPTPMLFNDRPAAEPRATRIPIPGREDIATELWMGGAQSGLGEVVQAEDLRDAWVLDLAGDMPEAYRPACVCWLARAFADMEQIPDDYARLAALAQSIAACLEGANAEDGWEHPATAPRRLYVMCNQGMNRSGLLTGLILRALGVPGEAAVAAIGDRRPGALSNQTFARLVREWERQPAGKRGTGAGSRQARDRSRRSGQDEAGSASPAGLPGSDGGGVA